MNHSTQTAPEDVFRAFLKDWETQGFVPAFERWLARDAIWENTFPPQPKG